MSKPNQTWRTFSRLCTLFTPDEWLTFAIPRGNGESEQEWRDRVQAWREKVALCVIMLAANLGFLGFGGLIGILKCGSPTTESGRDADGLSFHDHLYGITGSFENAINHEDSTCRFLNITMLATMFIIVAILAVQCLCSLIYLLRFGRTCCKAVQGERYQSAKVIVTVPCYNEGTEELTKTINSVRDESYPNERKLLVFIADGNKKGKDSDGFDNYETTPVILSDLLGYTKTEHDPIYSCDSTGYETNENGEKIPIGNRAKIYHGTKDGLQYMVIEKCGLPVEGDVGNRGKRDSQVMLLQLLNRVQHNHKLNLQPGHARYRDLNELETALENAFRRLDFPLTSDRAVGEQDGLDEVKYLMAVDADTRLSTDSITQMVYSMETKPKTLALCGETKVDNKDDSWVTKMQVFEYYTNHGLKKAFESVFGTVTCLPGCFTMYRLFDTSDSSQPPEPLFACEYVYSCYSRNDAEIETLHEKNLYKLGEDRMLTTLLLQKWNRMHLKYVPEAHCYTIVPDKFSVLLSQRRRWINSTFHNMLYLLSVGLGGICCFSMKFILILDMIGTLILPSSMLYLAMMMYNAIIGHSQMSTITLLVLGFSIAVQIIGPLLRFKIKYMWYAFVYYIVGVPVFYFVLPLYSFWHLDDFSWGSTRIVADEPNNIKATTVDAMDDEEQGSSDAQESSATSKSNANATNEEEEIERNVDVDEKDTETEGDERKYRYQEKNTHPQSLFRPSANADEGQLYLLSSSISQRQRSVPEFTNNRKASTVDTLDEEKGSVDAQECNNDTSNVNATDEEEGIKRSGDADEKDKVIKLKLSPSGLTTLWERWTSIRGGRATLSLARDETEE